MQAPQRRYLADPLRVAVGDADERPLTSWPPVNSVPVLFAWEVSSELSVCGEVPVCRGLDTGLDERLG